MASSKDNKNNSQLSHISARNLTHWRKTITPPSDSSEGCLGGWSMSSLSAILPKSPSPTCSDSSCPPNSSTCSTKSEVPSSQVLSASSTARNQSSCAVSNDGQNHTSNSEIMKWMENAKSYCHFRRPFLQNNHLKAADDKLSSQTLPSTEAGPILEELNHLTHANGIEEAPEAESLDNERQKLLSRLKPYHSFLVEVKQREHAAEIDSWKKTENEKLVDKLQREEAAINEWESKKIEKVTEKMKKYESKLERKRLQALEKTQKDISRTKKEANRRISKARRSTIEKISAVHGFSAKARATKNFLLLKLRKFY